MGIFQHAVNCPTVLHFNPKTLERVFSGLEVCIGFCVLYVNRTLFDCFFFFASGRVEAFVFSLKISLNMAVEVVYTLPFSSSQTRRRVRTHNRLLPLPQSFVGCAWGKKASAVIL